MIPSLLIAIITGAFRRFSVYIDWHNFGYSILEISNRPSILVRLTKFYEKYLGYLANLHFCVSKSMQNWLHSNWGIHAEVLYDRPADHFKNIENRQEERKRLGVEGFAVITSTSWTPDENFDILLEAFDILDGSINSQNSINLYITGKGPLKEHYVNLMRDRWQNCSASTVWLEPEDYPVMLSICDLGVCLHTSSSGYDLPMKLVDMDGACIPAIAYEYETIHEMTDQTFTSGVDLARLIQKYYDDGEKLQTWRSEKVEQRYVNTWQNEWTNVVKSTLDKSPSYMRQIVAWSALLLLVIWLF